MIPPPVRAALDPEAWKRPAVALRSALDAGRAPLEPPPLGRIGDLEVRLAAGLREVRRAQRIRFKVFYEQGSAKPSAAAALWRRDLCAFDAVCDHLVVVDHAAIRRRTGLPRPKIVGTYRLLRQEVAERRGGFYTETQFAIRPLIARHPDKRFLELGRACVLPRYRAKRTIELLWRGIWAYARHHSADVLFGCASFEGVDVDALARPLEALRRFAPAGPDWQAVAVSGRAAKAPALAVAPVERRDALATLPPLIKGYLRAGARFCDGAVVDPVFNTTDVLAVLPLDELDPRYLAHFGG